MSTQAGIDLVTLAALLGAVLACSGCLEADDFDLDLGDIGFEALDPPSNVTVSDGTCTAGSAAGRTGSLDSRWPADHDAAAASRTRLRCAPTTRQSSVMSPGT